MRVGIQRIFFLFATSLGELWVSKKHLWLFKSTDGTDRQAQVSLVYYNRRQQGRIMDKQVLRGGMKAWHPALLGNEDRPNNQPTPADRKRGRQTRPDHREVTLHVSKSLRRLNPKAQ